MTDRQFRSRLAKFDRTRSNLTKIDRKWRSILPVFLVVNPNNQEGHYIYKHITASIGVKIDRNK